MAANRLPDHHKAYKTKPQSGYGSIFRPYHEDKQEHWLHLDKKNIQPIDSCVHHRLILVCIVFALICYSMKFWQLLLLLLRARWQSHNNLNHFSITVFVAFVSAIYNVVCWCVFCVAWIVDSWSPHVRTRAQLDRSSLMQTSPAPPPE